VPGTIALSCCLISQDSSISRTIQALRRDAATRHFGDPMPSSRAIGSELGVGPVTVQRAVAQLVAEGILTTRPGVGTFVARPSLKPVADTDWQQVALGASPVQPAGLDFLHRMRDLDVLQMASGYADSSVRPDGRIAAAMARAARRPDAWSAPPLIGVPELRSWFASEIGVHQDDVIISPGCQGALSATMRALVPSGSPVLFAVPTYPGALAVARSAGLTPVPVPCDVDGVRPDLLERAFQSSGARVLYLQPTFANPEGNVLAAHRRGEVLEVVTAAGAFILEDDWARWLGHGPTPPPPLIRDDDNGHVITMVSLTKASAPSLRVGAIAARGAVLQRIAAMRLVDDFFVSRPLQEASVDLVTSTGWQTHLRSFSALLRLRCQVLCSSLVKRMPQCAFELPAGGVCLWLRLPKGTDEARVVERALAHGVAVSPGSIYAIGESEHPHVRLSFVAIDTSSIDEAVRRLSEAVEESA
jgi:DNA-binding transcriptional MocR family regulator